MDPARRTAPSPRISVRRPRLGAWLARLGWLVLPFVCGPAVGDALDGASRPVQVVASGGMWAGWAGVLVATLVPSTVSLTALRVAAPAPVVASVAAAVAGGAPSGAEILALAGSLAVALVALSPPVGEVFVDGSSYGDERRMPLRAPGPLLLGPVEVAWCVAAAGIAAGPLLLAAERWVAGGVALAAGPPAAWLAVRALHTLARRWVVFVPAGLVVHDPLALVNAMLVRREALRSLGPAPADTNALDLTRGALGLALEI
ncbi:MAG TPA: hypothetical protein VFZ68_05580, partial [Acidimicrobiales bacterium]